MLALGGGSVSFAQIVKACEPVFAAIIALIVPPVEVKPALAYMMLLVIVGGVGLACVKEGKGVEINMCPRLYPQTPPSVHRVLQGLCTDDTTLKGLGTYDTVLQGLGTAAHLDQGLGIVGPYASISD